MSLSFRLTAQLLFFVFTVFDTSDVNIGLVGHNNTTRDLRHDCYVRGAQSQLAARMRTYQPLVTSENDRGQHSLIEAEVTHPLADNNVDLRNGQFDLFDLGLNQFNN